MATKQKTFVAVAKELGSLSNQTDHEARLEALALDAHDLDVLGACFKSGWGATFEGLTVEAGHVTAITLTPSGHRRSAPPLVGPLRELPALRALTVSGYLGKSAEVEPDFFAIPSLTTLSISSLTKGTLPPELATLTGLRALEVKSCKLVALSAGTLPPSLTSLALEFQSFKTTPDAVFEVATLETLSLEDNAISSDAGAWDRLTALRTLSFASNKLRAIPNLLASQTVRRLTRLNLIRNPVEIAQSTRDALVGVEILPG
jgi:Leucine-rich repeat (LRR) protein